MWLALSPLIFGYPAGEIFYWLNDFSAAWLISILALGSYYRPLGLSHIGIVFIGIWLIVLGFIPESPPPPPMFQNYIVTGLVLIMLGVLPNHSEKVPNSWLRFYEKKTGQ